MPGSSFFVVPDLPRDSAANAARLRRALEACGTLRTWSWGERGEGLEHAAGLAVAAGCRAGVVADGVSAVECLERIARNFPRLPLALARFTPGPIEWSPRLYPGPGTPEAVWDLAPAPAAALAARVRRALDELAAPRFSGDPGLTTLIVPCWNGLSYTKRCLESVARWTDAPYEVVAVDNGSTDGTGAYLRSLRRPRVRVVSNKRNLGFARAINQGIAAARGRWIVWLNSDVIVTPGWLGGLLAAARRHPRVGAVGPYTNSINGLQRGGPGGYTMKTLPGAAQAWSLARAGRARSVHRLTGFCLLHPREAVDAIGGLDERFGLGCYEDFDFCLRLIQSGRELLLAEDVFLHHHGHKTFEENRVASRHIEENRRIFVDKWCRKSLLFLDGLDPELERR